MTEVNEFQHPLVVPEIKRAFTAASETPANEKGVLYWSSGTGEYGNVVVRLDWELTCEEEWVKRPYEGWNPFEKNVFMLMAEVAGSDMSDLIVNGDTNHVSDPLLGAIDGEKKRGAELKSFTINSVKAYNEFRIGKDSWEYTLYINASAGW